MHLQTEKEAAMARRFSWVGSLFFRLIRLFHTARFCFRRLQIKEREDSLILQSEIVAERADKERRQNVEEVDDRVIGRVGLDDADIHTVPQPGDNVRDGVQIARPFIAERPVEGAEDLSDEDEYGKYKVRDIGKQSHVQPI